MNRFRTKMKNLGFLVVSLVTLMGTLGFAAERYQISKPFIGTQLTIVTYAAEAEQAQQVLQQCWAQAKALESILSDYLPSSELNTLCAKELGEAHDVGEELLAVLVLAEQISEKTQGAFDVTVGALSKAWRNREDLSTVDASSYRDLVIDEAAKTVLLKKRLQLDLGAIGKGFIADRLLAHLQQKGLESAAVVIGGEMALGSKPPAKQGWQIAIENTQRQLVGTLSLSNCAVSTSGDSYQFFVQHDTRQAHILNNQSKKSLENRLNVVTIAPSAAEADAWATALRVLGLERGKKLASAEANIEAMFISHDGTQIGTLGFPKIQSHDDTKK